MTEDPDDNTTTHDPDGAEADTSSRSTASQLQLPTAQNAAPQDGVPSNAMHDRLHDHGSSSYGQISMQQPPRDQFGHLQAFEPDVALPHSMPAAQSAASSDRSSVGQLQASRQGSDVAALTIDAAGDALGMQRLPNMQPQVPGGMPQAVAAEAPARVEPALPGTLMLLCILDLLPR